MALTRLDGGARKAVRDTAPIDSCHPKRGNRVVLYRPKRGNQKDIYRPKRGNRANLNFPERDIFMRRRFTIHGEVPHVQPKGICPHARVEAWQRGVRPSHRGRPTNGEDHARPGIRRERVCEPSYHQLRDGSQGRARHLFPVPPRRRGVLQVPDGVSRREPQGAGLSRGLRRGAALPHGEELHQAACRGRSLRLHGDRIAHLR